MNPHDIPIVSVELLGNLALGLIWAGGAAVLALVGYVWNNLNKQVGNKVDREEHMHIQEKVDLLGNKFDEFSLKLEKQSDERHQAALVLNDIKHQLGRLVSHIDSETRNKTAQDTRIEQSFIGEIRALRHSIQGYGRRKSDPPESMPPI